MKATSGEPKREVNRNDLEGPVSNDGPGSLRQLQSFMWQAISRAPTGDFEMRKRWVDGTDLREVANQYVRASANLTSFQRLEIYNQQYWYRLLDCLEDDFPGLKSLLGERKFEKLSREYLSAHPSSRFSLRDLGENLVSFLEIRNDLIEPDVLLCLEMARFEWARIVAFDGMAREPIDEHFIKASAPETMALALQPYITLLELNYALDHYAIDLNRSQREPSEAGGGKPRVKRRLNSAPWPVREKVYLVVHRHENTVYLKRVELPAFAILSALHCGSTLSDSVMAALSRLEEDGIVDHNLERDMQDWFALWMRLGWLCCS